MTGIGGELIERLANALGPLRVTTKQVPTILNEVWMNRHARQCGRQGREVLP